MTTYQMFSPGYTEDYKSALLYISSLYPKAPLIGLGFSIGGSVVTRYLGQEGHNSRLVAGCSLGCVSVLCQMFTLLSLISGQI